MDGFWGSVRQHGGPLSTQSVQDIVKYLCSDKGKVKMRGGEVQPRGFNKYLHTWPLELTLLNSVFKKMVAKK